MKPFTLTPEMTSASGTFYPTGQVFALFRNEEAARDAARQLQEQHEDVMHAAPDAILQHVVRSLGNADDPLPSVGAEGVIVRRIAELASGGAHALMFTAGDDDTPDSLRTLLQQSGALAAFYYRRLIIEDLISS
ncbi:hypothetical protein [Melaminivora sp.]|uniref:hypothetical protein n=1 Tax=Melaminivora sp. TaxID=1933032 RepID=UPI0028A7C685|nr:hypothetical protein [Melaminivora sp.]